MAKLKMWFGIVLILAVGLIHVIEAPDSFQEAAYKGWLFYANGLAALVAAFGIYRRDCRGWHLGFLVAAGSLAVYIASRTVGLPLLPAEPDAWLEPLGLASMITEGLFVLLYLIPGQSGHCGK
ncbi:MAG: hypothetical protein HGA80_00580 [Candidatus Omnitrophica bacterium]|nr:hypothetical protein [Candidatus Omnitrophota bacterium]